MVGNHKMVSNSCVLNFEAPQMRPHHAQNMLNLLPTLLANQIVNSSGVGALPVPSEHSWASDRSQEQTSAKVDLLTFSSDTLVAC